MQNVPLFGCGAQPMPLLFHDSRFLDHDPGEHPESPARLRAVAQMLATTGLIDRFTAGTPRPASDAELLRVHTPAHLAELARVSATGGGQVEVDTMMSQDSAAVARLAAGTACAAVDAVLTAAPTKNGNAQNGNAQSSARQAVCLFRPPGHHALSGGPMGFCLYNNVAVAAAQARAVHGLERVLIVDWDVHHGNGTQDIFYEDPAVTFVSIHRWPFYPGTGAANETGTGPGLGSTFNRPLRFGVSRRQFLADFNSLITTAADHCRPELVLISAGFDAHAADPIGSLGLENEDFVSLTEIVQQVAATHANGRLVSVLEGGYNVEVLPESVQAHLEALL